MVLDIIENVRDRRIIKRLSLKELVEFIRDPGQEYKNAVFAARYVGKGNLGYTAIKKALRCTCVNFNHHTKLVSKNIESTTGYLYLDIDEDQNLDLSHESIVAYWKSLSGVGYSVVIAATGLQKTNVKPCSHYVADMLGFKADEAAMTKSRVTVIPYDEFAVYNENYNPIDLSHISKYPPKKVKDEDEKVKGVSRCSGLDVEVYGIDNGIHLFNKDFRFNNLDEIQDSIDFEGDFHDFKTKVEYSEVTNRWKKIYSNRNNELFVMAVQVRALNMWVGYNDLLEFMEQMNRYKCHEPLPLLEVENIVKNALNVPKENLWLSFNGSKRFFFKDKNLSTREKQSIVAKTLNKERSKRDIIKTVIEEWDVETMGSFTQANVIRFLEGKPKEVGAKESSIKRHWKTLKEEINKKKLEISKKQHIFA